MPIFTKNEIIDVKEATVVDRNYLDPQISKVSSGNVSGVRSTTTTDYPEGSLRHEAKQKRHVIEEVFIEGSDKFYEKTSPKKSRKDELVYSRSTGELGSGVSEGVQVRGITTSRDDDVTLREHNRYLLESDIPTAKPRTKRGIQSELVVEDTNLFTDESTRQGMFNQDYKIKPMYSEKSRPLASQDVDSYFVKDHTRSGYEKEDVSQAKSTVRGGQQQEIVVGDVGTYREGTMDVDKNRSVEQINKDEKSKTFKKRMNQKDIKLLPKTRHRQEEIVINDPTVYDETQFLSLRKTKKKRLFENPKTLPAKFGKKSKAQIDREVDLIIKKSEEIAEGKHANPVRDVQEQMVLDEPDIFRETTTRKKQNISLGSLEKQHKQLEKMEKELESKSFGKLEFDKHKGVQEEIVIDDPEVFRESTLKRKKVEKPSSSKIMKDILQDIDVLTQETRKSGLDAKQDELNSVGVVNESRSHQHELVLEDNDVYKENTLKKMVKPTKSGETRIVDEMKVEHVEIKKGIIASQREETNQKEIVVDFKGSVKEVDLRKDVDKAPSSAVKTDHGQQQIILDDHTLFADHNKPKNIHLEHGKAIQMAEMDDFDLPELEKSDAEKQTFETKPEKSEKKSSKPKKFLFKKKKKSQGESMVDESFVYEDAAKIRFPEVPKNDENETKVGATSSSKSFWNWNFGHKHQQEVIKDDSHYHEDKVETEEQKHEDVDTTKHAKEIEHIRQEITIEPPLNFQDSKVEVKEVLADMKIIHESSPEELKLQETKQDQIRMDKTTIVISKPDVVTVDDAQKSLIVEEENLKRSEDEEVQGKETPKEKPKFKINLPSFTIPKPHLNFGFKKHQPENVTEEQLTVFENVDAKVNVEPRQVVEEKMPGEVGMDIGVSQGEVVREHEMIVVEESKKSKDSTPEKMDQGETKGETKQSKADSHKSKFHFPSFTIPKPHINFGFKKHQPETIESDKNVVKEETKVEEVTPKVTKKEGEVVQPKEKIILQEDVFVEQSHDKTKDVEVLEGQDITTHIESQVGEDTQKHDEKSHDNKFKINLPHLPKPHMNIHFKKSKDEEQSEEIEKEEHEKREDVKTEKIKFTVPHINLHLPHIHFTSAQKQDEVVVEDDTVIPESSQIIIASEDDTTDAMETKDLGKDKSEVVLPESVKVEEKTHAGEQTEIVKTNETQVSDENYESFKTEPSKGAGTLEEKSKRKIKFNFPHFSLPRSRGKQTESVANEVVVVEDSSKLKLTDKKVDNDVNDEHSEETASDSKDVHDKDKKSDHKFKIRIPKPHFKFGFKSKDKHKHEEVDSTKVETEENIKETHESKLKSDETAVKSESSEQQKEVPLEFLTQPCADEFTETVNYVLNADEDIPSVPVTIIVHPDEYKILVNKHKSEPINATDIQSSDVTTEVMAVDSSKKIDKASDNVSVPYYEYEPTDREARLEESVVISDKNVGEQTKNDEVEISKSELTPEQEITTRSETPKEESVIKSKSKFHFPCIKLKKPLLKKNADEPSSEDDPPYGEMSTEELHGNKRDDNKLQTNDETDKTTKKHAGFNIKSLGKKTAQEEIVVNDAHIYTDNSTLGRRLLNKLRHKDKVAPESNAFILENNLPESSENKPKIDLPVEEDIAESTNQPTLEQGVSKVDEHDPGSSVPKEQEVAVQSDLRVEDKSSPSDAATAEVDSGTLESSKGSDKGFDSILKHRKQNEVIIGGSSIVTEPQTSPLHRALHKQHLKSNEQVDKQSSQELHDAEKVVKRKDHGKLTSIFHRSSGEYDLDHQKRTNQPLVELISSRPKPSEEPEVNISIQDESSWSLNYRKNLTLDSTNHLTFESEYDPDQSVAIDNVQMVCPTARRSYRKHVQIDDFELLKTIDERGFKTSTPVKRLEGSAGDASEMTNDSSNTTPSKVSSSVAKAQPVSWTNSLGKNTSYFSTLPEFATVEDQQKSPHFVVVAIDFGTTFSGYAFSFKNDVDSIHIMRKWEGGDPGVINQKTPTTLLLTPDKEFHSFGFTARDFYHDLSPKEAKRWLYFEKFKMALHYNADLSSDTEIKAANGTTVKAQEVFAYALRFFKSHALQEISEQTGTELIEEDIKWVITVPAIWKSPAKQFMREAAYKAGIASSDKPDQLLIALEPEAASIFVRKQRLRQLIPEEVDELKDTRTAKSSQDLRGGTSSPVLLDSIAYQTQLDESSSWNQSVTSNALSLSFQRCPSPTSFPVAVGHEIDITDNRFMLADCGGGTVDITVYEMLSATGGKLKELHKATGGPYGSIGVDLEFEKLLESVFGRDFVEAFKIKRPAGWVDLMMAFESRKRAANPFKTKPLNVSLPFSFIDYYKKFKNATVESAIKKYNNKDIKWSSQGMMRMMPECIDKLFQPTLDNITNAVADVLRQPDVTGVKNIFLVGGFSESPMLQQEIRRNFSHQSRILIPTDVSLTILKGAVLYGIDPSIVVIRKSRLTYGLGVLNRFVEGKHPDSKKAMKDGVPWCVDVFDHLVLADQSVALGSSVIRSYTPAGPSQKFSLFHIYCTESRDVDYVTDDGVVKCGTLRLDLDDHQWEMESSPSRPVSQNLNSPPQDQETGQVIDGSKGRREIQARLTFGDTEIKIIALDVATGNYVRATLDFLNK